MRFDGEKCTLEKCSQMLFFVAIRVILREITSPVRRAMQLILQGAPKRRTPVRVQPDRSQTLLYVPASHPPRQTKGTNLLRTVLSPSWNLWAKPQRTVTLSCQLCRNAGGLLPHRPLGMPHEPPHLVGLARVAKGSGSAACLRCIVQREGGIELRRNLLQSLVVRRQLPQYAERLMLELGPQVLWYCGAERQVDM